jgi:hypothetical protein
MKAILQKLKKNQQKSIAMLAMVGGLLISLGTLLPWFSLFAGLHSFPGVAGLNGRILLGAGVVTVLAGIIFLLKKPKLLQDGINVLGIALFSFSIWLVVGLIQTYQKLASDPFVVANLGPGLFIVLLGSVLLVSTVFFRLRAEKFDR